MFKKKQKLPVRPLGSQADLDCRLYTDPAVQLLLSYTPNAVACSTSSLDKMFNGNAICQILVVCSFTMRRCCLANFGVLERGAAGQKPCRQARGRCRTLLYDRGAPESTSAIRQDMHASDRYSSIPVTFSIWQGPHASAQGLGATGLSMRYGADSASEEGRWRWWLIVELASSLLLVISGVYVPNTVINCCVSFPRAVQNHLAY